jgi:SAM-dependent methyltransferase
MIPSAAMYADGTYLTRNPNWHEEDAAWKASKVATMLTKHRLSPNSLCEVGCGSGQILVELSASLGCDIALTGYDISPDAIDICKGKEAPGLHFELSDPLGLDVHFDVVLAMDVIEHVDDYLGFLRALKDLATWKLLHIPLDLSVSSVARPKSLQTARDKVGHLHYFTRETALATLCEAGHVVVDSVLTSGATELQSSTLAGRLARLPRRLLRSVNPEFSARLLGGCSLLALTR